MEEWSSCRRSARSTTRSGRPRLTRGFLLTGGNRIGGMCMQGTQENKKRRVENARNIPLRENEPKATNLDVRKHLINLVEAMTKRERSLRVCREWDLSRRLHELGVEEASDKPRRRCERERIDENWHKFPGDIMAWHGGGQSAKNECL
jgi:hypothetical protein